MVDPLINKADFVVDWFRVKADETANDAVKRSQQQAVDSFCCFPGGTSIKFGDITEEILSEWVSWMFCQGYSYGTVLTYTERLSALYGRAVKEGLVVDNGCFATVKRRLKSVSATGLEIYSLPNFFNKLRKLVLADYSKNPALQLARDLVLFSLYNGGLSFDRLAGYRKDDYEGCDESVIKIIERYAKAKNKYLFPLNQSARTPKQLKISISSLFADAMKAVGISLSSHEEGLPTELWALIAMRCGIAPSEIAGCINEVNKVSPVYSFVKRTELTEERKDAIRSHVTRILSKNPEDWYAMQFRPHVSYERVKERMRSAGIAFSKSFYPMEEIVRRIDKKLVRESRPVIPGLLFFKRRATELPELYFHIGDLAWGYRYGRGSDSSYAIIPQKAIEDYERAVGKFVDGMDAYPEGMFHLEAGDKVEITGGAFSGQPAVFEKEVHEIDKGTHQTVKLTYRLRLEGMQNCAWVVELDPRQMSKITDERFESLRNKIHTVVDSND